MPHLLVAGTTRREERFVNALLLSLLYQNAPDDLRLILLIEARGALALQ